MAQREEYWQLKSNVLDSSTGQDTFSVCWKNHYPYDVFTKQIGKSIQNVLK